MTPPVLKSARAEAAPPYSGAELRTFLRLPPYEPKPKSPHFHVYKVPSNKWKEKEHVKHKYIIDLPLDGLASEYLKLNDEEMKHNKPLNELLHLDMKAVTLTVWSEKDLELNDDPNSFIKALQYDRVTNPNLPTFFGSGYLAHADQIDRRSSLVDSLAKRLHMARKDAIFNNVIIGLSCPGFQGSETDHAPNEKTVGVKSYERLMEALLLTLHPKRASLVGHSAGGAGVAFFVHEFKKDLDDSTYAEELRRDPLRKAIQRTLRKNTTFRFVSLHPAINKSEAWQFGLLKTALQVEKFFMVDRDGVLLKGIQKLLSLAGKKISDDEVTRYVVKYLLGLDPFKMGTKDQEDQVTLHCDMLVQCMQASYAKLDDLVIPQEARENTRANSNMVVGVVDRITPARQILEALSLIDAKDELSDKEIEARLTQLQANGLIQKRNTHHDDLFMNPEATEDYAHTIAEIIKGLIS